jgi:hypothetical protein
MGPMDAFQWLIVLAFFMLCGATLFVVMVTEKVIGYLSGLGEDTDDI